MLSNLVKLLSLSILLLLGLVGIWFYREHTASARKQQELMQENTVLQQVIERLSSEKRVAEALVTEQKTVNGVLHSTILFVESDKSGNALPPKRFEVAGTMIHFDAQVVKFDRELVKQNDPLRGHSIALFTSIYGDAQTPASGLPIDEPGKIPDAYRGADPQISQYELSLWKDFWQLAEDESYRKTRGVRIANGQGVWLPMSQGKLYTFSIESDGGLNYRSEPLRGIYREALKNH